MKTYHYTSKNNWEKIKIFGFQPYVISKPELDSFFPGGVNGVWLWKNKPTGHSNMGCILFQFATKSETDIVLLEVEIDEGNLLHFGDRLVELPHTGSIGNYQYHEAEKGVIYTSTISPNKIKLLKTFDIVKLLK